MFYVMMIDSHKKLLVNNRNQLEMYVNSLYAKINTFTTATYFGPYNLRQLSFTIKLIIALKIQQLYGI